MLSTARNIGRAALAALVGIGAGCKNPFDFGTPDPNAFNFDLAGTALYSCSKTNDPPAGAALLAAFDTAAGDSFDLPLSMGGCWRLQGTSADYKLVHHTGGASNPRVVLKRTGGGTAKVHTEADDNEDGFAEWVSDSTYDGQGAFVSSVVQTLSASSHEVSTEVATTAVSATLRHVVVKGRASGQLAVESEYDSKFPQQMCYPPPKPNNNPCTWSEVACTAGQTAALREALAEAVLKTQTCASGAFRSHSIAAYMVPRLSFKCRSGGCSRGQQDDGPWGSVIINVDSSEFSKGELSTVVFHELAHTFLPPHDAAKEAAGAAAGLLYESDPLWACQAMCFGAMPTRCQCARCFNDCTTGSRCGGYADCDKLGRVTNVTATETLAFCGADGVMCDTMMDCKSGCSKGASCDDMTMSCDSSCN